MEHPSYNNWTLRERLALPPVRTAAWKFGLLATAVAVTTGLYLAGSVLIVTSAPVFYAHLDSVQEERWRNKAAFYGRACANNSTHFVVIDCNQTHAASTRDNFKETLTRTFAELAEQQHAITELLGCKDTDGLCMSVVYVVLDIVINHRMLMMGLWWLSTTAMLAAAWRGALVRYWRLLQQQLSAVSPDAMQYNAMTAAVKEEWIAAQAAQALSAAMPMTMPQSLEPRYIEYQPWTPAKPSAFDLIPEGNENDDENDEEIKVGEEGGPPNGSRRSSTYPGTPLRRRGYN